MNRDIVFAARRLTNRLFTVANKAIRPFEIDVFDRRSGLLLHDVCEGRSLTCDVGDCEVAVHGVGCEEKGDIVELGHWVGGGLGGYAEDAVAGDVEGDVEEVAAHRCEWLRL